MEENNNDVQEIRKDGFKEGVQAFKIKSLGIFFKLLGGEKAKCNYCNNDYGGHRIKDGTVGLKTHLDVCPLFKKKKK